MSRRAARAFVGGLGRTLRWAATGAMALGGLWLLAFGPRAEEAIPPGRVVVDYWEKWSGREADTMRTLVDEFNATVGAEQGIWVRFVSLAQVDQKMRIATAAGVPPDVAGLWGEKLSQLAASDALEPLDALAAEAGIARDDYKPVYYDDCVHDGRLVALPTTPATVALLWNKQIFADEAEALRAAGCDPMRPPRTIEELDRYAAALDEWETDDLGRRRLVRAGFMPMEPGWFVAHQWRWFGGDIWDTSAPPERRLRLTDARVVAAYEWMASYGRRLGRPAMGAFAEGDRTLSPQNPFATGKVAMVQQGPWMAAYLETFAPHMNRARWDKAIERAMPRERRAENYVWAAAPFPAAEGVGAGGPVTVTNLDVVAIPRGARHKREAFAFIRFLQRPDVMERLCTAQCKPSPLAAVSRRFYDEHPNPYIDVFDALAASPNAHFVTHSPVWPAISVELINVAQSATAGTADPRAALSAAQARLDLAWARFREERTKRGGT